MPGPILVYFTDFVKVVYPFKRLEECRERGRGGGGEKRVYQILIKKILIWEGGGWAAAGTGSTN